MTVLPINTYDSGVLICDTFDNNLEIDNDFTRHLEEGCWLCSNEFFLNQRISLLLPARFNPNWQTSFGRCDAFGISHYYTKIVSE